MSSNFVCGAVALAEFSPIHRGMGLRLREYREATGATLEDVGEALSISSGQVSRLERSESDLTIKRLNEFANYYGCEPVDLISDTVPLNRVTVYGEVRAGHFWGADEWDDYDRFDVSVDIDKLNPKYTRFGLRVDGTSMNEVYPDGSVLVCVPLAEIERWPQHGERVIVYRRAMETGEFEATCKEFQKYDGKYWLVARSDDPAHKGTSIEIALDPTDIAEQTASLEFGQNGEEVQIAALVISSVRPEAVDI